MQPEFPPRATAESVRVEGAPMIRMAGECDLEIAPAVRELIEAAVASGQLRIVFDLERVTFLDSTVLGLFIFAREKVLPDGEVVLLCRPGFVRRLLHLLQLHEIMQVLTPEEWRAQTVAVQ